MANESGSGEVLFQQFAEGLGFSAFHGASSAAFGVCEQPAEFVQPVLKALEIQGSANVTLVSARGATGKSTTARALSADLGIPLWQLNLDKSVSGDALSSRLREYQASADDRGGVIIDALDEARLRVSEISWQEFAASVAAAAGDGYRVLLLGRDRVIEDFWVRLVDLEIEADLYELSHFGPSQRTEYIDLRLGKGADGENVVYREARDAVLSALAGSVDDELAEAFVGYPPVLDAVVALLGKGSNFFNIKTDFSSERLDRGRVDVLVDVLERLLEREQGKVSELASDLGLEPATAYTAAEQLQWLSSELFDGSQPTLDWCPLAIRSDYVSQIRQFLEDHPFRSGTKWVSSVFSAYTASARFDDPSIAKRLCEVGAGSGLLYEFTAHGSEDLTVDELQFAALHYSLLASEWKSVQAVVEVAGSSALAGDGSVRGELILTTDRGVASRTTLELLLDDAAELRLYGPLSALSCRFDGKATLVPRSESVTLGPDCYIYSKVLESSALSIQVSRQLADTVGGGTHEDESVVLEVSDSFECPGQLLGSPPEGVLALRTPLVLKPGYPWISYWAELEVDDVPPGDRAKRFLKMFMKLARRHGHSGPAAVYDKKLAGRQSVKGEEMQCALRAMQDMGVIEYSSSMIKLAPSWESARFSAQAVPGQMTLEDRLDAWGPVLERISACLRRD